MDRRGPMLLVLLALLGTLSACGSQGLVVDVFLSGRPAQAVSLLVTSVYDGEAALGGGDQLTRGLDHFRVLLPEGLQGQLQIHVSALDTAGCQVAAGDGAVALTGAGRYTLDISLGPAPGCMLVAQRAGSLAEFGTVSAGDAGIDCGQACSQRFAQPGAAVQLTAQWQAPAYFGGWYADRIATACRGRDPGGCTVQVGSGVTVVRADFLPDPGCTTANWCDEVDRPPLSTDLRALWGSWEQDVWAAGNGGLVVHGDGTSWVQVPVPTSSRISGLWGSGLGDVWAVGDGGTVLRWNGASFAAARTGGATLYAVWGTGPRDVWAVGQGGVLLRGDGVSWSESTIGPGLDLYAIWGSGQKDVWLAGDRGLVLHWDGNGFATVAGGTGLAGLALRAAWGSGPDDVWFAGDRGTLLHWTGGGLGPVDSGTTVDLHGLWGPEANIAWAVGDGGTLLRWDGTTWHPLSVAEQRTTSKLAAVWGSGPVDAWAAGAGFALIRYRP